jgi:hypothetical protein
MPSKLERGNVTKLKSDNVEKQKHDKVRLKTKQNKQTKKDKCRDAARTRRYVKVYGYDMT